MHGATNPTAAGLTTGPALCVLGGFALSAEGRGVRVPWNAQRVLGYLALNRVGQRRDVLAGRLWSDTTQARAQANLRTAVWKVRQALPGVVDCGRHSVALRPEVRVDYDRMNALTERLLHRELSCPELLTVPRGLLAAELLPGWEDEDWLFVDRERHRQRRMQALVALSGQLTEADHFALAVDAAFAAIAIEPLWEPATLALLQAHMADGNRAEALRQFSMFQQLLADETGLVPSSQLAELMGPVLDGATAVRGGRVTGPVAPPLRRAV
jgi:DNA-binding SARP family transcriptional activator